MHLVTLTDVEHIIFSLTREKLSFNEPIPDFNTRYPNVLESCLLTPLQTFGGNELYPTLINKITILFYLMVKNHPFQNGNKRVAMVTLMYVLYDNKKWLEVNSQILYNFALWVAESPPLAKKEMISYIGKFIEKYAVTLKD